MEPVSRRTALLLGGTGAAAAAVGAAGLLWRQSASFRSAGGQEFTEPSALRSSSGTLQTTLSAGRGTVQVGGRDAAVLSYNGSLPGPTLFLRPGDRARVRLENQLGEPTNLHVHGLHVSPAGNSDNAMLSVEPGASFDYEFRLPEDHPPGTFWYHPHHHGFVAEQVSGGLYGAIIVEEADPVPVSRDRVMVVSDVALSPDGTLAGVTAMERMSGREGSLVLVNGQANPKLSAAPGQRERWRIINACTARYLDLHLDGQRLQLLGMDSGRFREPKNVQEVRLAPGNRADLLVTSVSGTSTLRTLPVDRGSTGTMMGSIARERQSPEPAEGIVLATLSVTGASAAVPAPVPAQPQRRDLRAVAVAARRELVFAMGMGGGMGNGMMSFTIDGHRFDPARVDTTVALGTVEEWTLRNTSPMDHPMHLHIWPMQVIESTGTPTADELAWQDVVNIPARGSVRVRIAFDDFPGRTVYHCHILDHEDLGMMGVLEAR